VIAKRIVKLWQLASAEALVAAGHMQVNAAAPSPAQHVPVVAAPPPPVAAVPAVQVIRNYICSVYMGNVCIRAYGDSLIKVILAGKVTHISHKTCKYNFLLPVLYIYTIHTYVQGQRVGKHFVKINKVHNIGNTSYLIAVQLIRVLYYMVMYDT
jgi:hypothetical protein